MDYRTGIFGVVLAVGAVAAIPAWSQALPTRPATQGVVEKPSNMDPATSKNLTEIVAATIRDAADGMGMARWDRNKAPPRIAYDTVHSFMFYASGTYGEVKSNKITISMDYVLPGIRADVEKAPGQREITVAAGKLSWDESKPGVFAKASTQAAADRQRLMWIFPPAIVHAAVMAPEKVKVADRAGRKEMTVVAPDGTEIKALLGAKNRISNVEMQSGGKTYVGEYADYIEDFQDLEVMLPSKVVQKIDGKVVNDFTIWEHYPNPYVIFPTPKELK